MTTHVWYHSNCYDGFGAAWAASKALGREGVVYTPCSYGYPPPEFDHGDNIIIVDFSFPRDVLLDLKQKAGSIDVHDHHKTAEAALEGLSFCRFDMNRSGAGMAWYHFHAGIPRPRLIQHIEDRDLWRFAVPGSKEVHAYLCAHPFDFAVWDRIAEELERDPERIYAIGASLLGAKLMEVEKTCKSAWLGQYAGSKVAVVNTAAHWSEIGHHLLEKFPEAAFAASFTVFADQVMWSLRGRGDFDVSELAKQFGGGGHKSAAGFKAKTLAEAPWFLALEQTK